MKPAHFDRSRKIKILSRVLTGQTALLNQHKQLNQPKKSFFTSEQLEVMTDEQLTAISQLRPGNHRPGIKPLTDEQVMDILKTISYEIT